MCVGSVLILLCGASRGGKSRRGKGCCVGVGIAGRRNTLTDVLTHETDTFICARVDVTFAPALLAASVILRCWIHFFYCSRQGDDASWQVRSTCVFAVFFFFFCRDCGKHARTAVLRPSSGSPRPRRKKQKKNQGRQDHEWLSEWQPFSPKNKGAQPHSPRAN